MSGNGRLNFGALLPADRGSGVDAAAMLVIGCADGENHPEGFFTPELHPRGSASGVDIECVGTRDAHW